MFFEGAPRLERSGVNIPHLKKVDDKRIVVEAYPGKLVRQLMGSRKSYKSDTKQKQSAEHRKVRAALFHKLHSSSFFKRFGFNVEAREELCDDRSGDQLDALLCAIQAAWAWQNIDKNYGAPNSVDALEGWIANPLS